MKLDDVSRGEPELICIFKLTYEIDCDVINRFTQYKAKKTHKNNPTPRYKGQFLQFGWRDKKYFYTKMIPKHYLTMDEKCAEIGWAAKKISNNLSRGALSHGFLYKNF